MTTKISSRDQAARAEFMKMKEQALAKDELGRANFLEMGETGPLRDYALDHMDKTSADDPKGNEAFFAQQFQDLLAGIDAGNIDGDNNSKRQVVFFVEDHAK